MSGLQPGDGVEWRAGTTPSTFHTRRGVIKEILPSGLALVKVQVERETIVEEIRAVRLRKIEPPEPVKEKKTADPGGKGKKTAGKKTAAKA